MAKLISQDVETKSALEIVALPQRAPDGKEIWQQVEVRLLSGENVLTTATFALQDNCVLCRVPRDEIAQLLDLLNEVMRLQIETFNFEPLEPFFELTVEQMGERGFKIEAWLDAGDAQTGIYTWDALGIRFHTSKDHLSSFICDLQAESPC
jgi:hypothetical protein